MIFSGEKRHHRVGEMWLVGPAEVIKCLYTNDLNRQPGLSALIDNKGPSCAPELPSKINHLPGLPVSLRAIVQQKFFDIGGGIPNSSQNPVSAA